jgi:DUF1680 family protein
MKRQILTAAMMILAAQAMSAQTGGITDTHNSKYAKMNATPLNAVRWTGGFWGERFNVFSKTSLQSMWNTWRTDYGKGYNNFLIAAGEKEGVHHGPPFHDGDMYKWLEGVAATYAITKDKELDKIMDQFISLIIKSQDDNGYIGTQVRIARMNANKNIKATDNTVVGTAVGTDKDGMFGNMLNFETYNLGHLITAGIIHKRATGKTTLYNCALKAADFLYRFYEQAPKTLAKNAVCPSHYMAMNELYRETGNKKYLKLAQELINIRSLVKDGTDDNQDRIPFREQYKAIGHSVRANYLYAGVADLYLEDGEAQLKKNLDSIWNDITYRKMYINGACGALYDGTSPDGTDYQPANIQKIHQAYGRPYQLPQLTAHNETCANIGNMLLNWRLYLTSGKGINMDIVENCLYNSIMPGISLDGKKYFYVNPLRMSNDLPYTLRWPKERQEYISCFCCPPNTLRTLCEAQDYAYSTAKDTLYVNLYGENKLQLKEISLSQHTDYPWDGKITFHVDKAVKKNITLKLRVPEWVDNVSDVEVRASDKASYKIEDGFITITGSWKKGDEVAINMPMRTKLIEANPLVEELRGQVAVQRGPIIYCLESQDLNGAKLDDIMIPSDAEFTPVETTIDGSRIMALEANVLKRGEDSWKGKLYRESSKKYGNAKVRFIPYFAWGNRGKSEMEVFVPEAIK